MSCNGCRVLRKGCNDNCVLRPCLQWIDSADAQGNATVFVAKFFGRAGLMGFIGAVPEDQRAALFQSLLYEACGRTVNPVHGALGLLWSGKWNVCEAAVETVLKGGSLKPPAQAVLAVASTGNNTGGFPRATAGMAAAAPMQQHDCFTLQQQQQHLLERMPASLTLPRSSPRLNTNRARSSFTGHHSPATANVGDRLAGLVPPSGAPVHELDNASEISSAGTSSRLMSLEAAAEELRRRDMSLSIRQDWEQHQQQRQGGGGAGGGGFIGQGKENGGEWRMQHNVSASEISRRTWQETCNPAALAHQQQQQQGGFWSGPALIREDLTRRLQQQQSFDPRVKREYRDVQQGVVASPEPPRRVQPRLELDSSPFKDQTCLEMHETAAAAWDASEAEARGSSGNNGGKVAPMELNLTLNSSFASTAKEQQMRKPSASAGVRVSSPSCGSINSEGSVTSLHSHKPVVSPWTLQLASESQSNRQLLPLLR